MTSKLPWRVGSGDGYTWQFSTGMGLERTAFESPQDFMVQVIKKLFSSSFFLLVTSQLIFFFAVVHNNFVCGLKINHMRDVHSLFILGQLAQT